MKYSSQREGFIVTDSNVLGINGNDKVLVLEGQKMLKLDSPHSTSINDSIKALLDQCKEITVTFVPENLDPVHPFRDSQVWDH